MVGRPRKPTALKILEGNRGKRKLDMSAEPEPSQRIPKCPLELDKDGKRFWKHYTEILDRCQIITEADGAVLAAFCSALSTIVQAEAIIATEGMISEGVNKGGTSYKMTHPAVGIRDKNMKLMQSLASQLGLDPSSRSRVQKRDATKQDDLEALLA